MTSGASPAMQTVNLVQAAIGEDQRFPSSGRSRPEEYQVSEAVPTSEPLGVPTRSAFNRNVQRPARGQDGAKSAQKRVLHRAKLLFPP
jgi:hypothetical protein